jgi:general secretion pathway protein A
MYEEFYGFVHPPFTLAPDPRFLYRSQSHDEAITALLQAIRRREGFIVLAGDIGTGKTTICRALLEHLDQTTFTSLVLNPFLSIEELLREILIDFGVVSRDAVRSGRIASATRHELISTLHEFLRSLIAIRGSGVLIIDEAQHLPAETLEQIRVISNLETNEARLLQIVLVGQLNLLDALNQPAMRDLDQRVSLRVLLKPLTREEVDAYISHRLSIAGAPTDLTFEPAALDRVHAFSGGVPRVINLLCDRALMVAAESKATTVTPEFVDEAAGRLELSLPKSVRRRLASAPKRTATARKWAVTVPKWRITVPRWRITAPAWPVFSPKWAMIAAGVVLMIAAGVLLPPWHRLVDLTLPPAPASPGIRLPITQPIAPLPVPDVVIPTPRNLLLIPGYR